MIGPGRYDDVATFVRRLTSATGVLLVVLKGDRGSGFSAQLTPEATLTLPQMLRHLADQIDSSTRN